jgi:hypothetical protein
MNISSHFTAKIVYFGLLSGFPLGLLFFPSRCPYLHRVAGDVERRYHLRYYKTATCVYETDSRGYCVKNGPHCAFAHGPHDLRQPVYDVRELQAMEKEDIEGQQGGENKAVIEDPRWQGLYFELRLFEYFAVLSKFFRELPFAE